jgi:hypothetical protein
MRAVWSLWSKPFAAATSWGWHRPEHHLLAWGLSLRLARRHYPETTLVTDSAGKALLVDALGLSFASVSTELDRLRDADPNLWALGKLVAYSIQDEPFVHLDTDVFLWRALPTRLTSAPVLAQHRERWFERDPGGGDPQLIEDAFAHAGLKLPVEWEWARSRWGKTVFEANCGIAGGHDVDFIRHYARLALELATSPRHAGAWASLPAKQPLNPTIEQFTLSACLDFHRSHPDSPFKGVHARYLFPSPQAAFDPRYAARLGFTHLLGDTKRHARVAQRLEERVRTEDERFYARCMELAAAG